MQQAAEGLGLTGQSRTLNNVRVTSVKLLIVDSKRTSAMSVRGQLTHQKGVGIRPLRVGTGHFTASVTLQFIGRTCGEE
jgi:hypothetical protein